MMCTWPECPYERAIGDPNFCYLHRKIADGLIVATRGSGTGISIEAV
jgi:hypothetical protein